MHEQNEEKILDLAAQMTTEEQTILAAFIGKIHAAKTVGDRLKAFRGCLNITIDQVASSVGAEAEAIKAMENNILQPVDEMKRKLADFYGAPIEELFSPIFRATTEGSGRNG